MNRAPQLIAPSTGNGYSAKDNADLRTAQAKATRIAQKAVEDGEDFLTAFDTAMTGFGFAYTADHCMCVKDPDLGGHEPACGWSRI